MWIPLCKLAKTLFDAFSQLRSVELEIRLNGSARKPPILPGAWIFRFCTQTSNPTRSLDFKVLHANPQPYQEPGFQVLHSNLQPYQEPGFSGSARKPPTLPGAWMFRFCTQTFNPTRSLDFQALYANLQPYHEPGFSGSAR